ncbi:MAG: MFS transporter [Ignavibacteriaceae bacterium]|nr:MFS transporter [Ignavibacteriaceae bacterium]
MSKLKSTIRNAWAWVPSLYYAEGIPYVVVMLVSVVMYKRMGVSNTDIAFYTSLLYLPWVIKPLWSPFVDLIKTKRFWIVVMQLIIGAGLAGVAFVIPGPDFLKYSLAFLFLLAFSSATHDIAADGFYMLGLDEHDQAFYVGIRSTFYRLAMITGQGILVIIAGYFEVHSGLPRVEITVNSAPKTLTETVVNLDSINFNRNFDDLRVLSSSNKFDVATAKINKAQVDSLITLAQYKNIKNGFYTNQKIGEQPEFNITPESRNVKVGNVSIIAFSLSKAPEDKNEVVVNVDRSSGDKSISLIEGTRFVFNKSNWDKAAIAIVQLDPKLKSATTTSFEALSGDIPRAWSMTFFIIAGLFIAFFIYHYIILPYPSTDVPAVKDPSQKMGKEFFRSFIIFFKKKQIGLAIAFLLIYRFGEAQLIKLTAPFLIDARELGGLGLTTGEYGLVYGTIGIIGLTIGGITGGFYAAKVGLKKSIWWMFAAINIPNLLYVYLAFFQPDNIFIISASVALEQFGYGFGFTAYMLYMIHISEGDFKTSHYAIATGFMALSMMIPGLFAGWLQELLGYQFFFVWIMVAMIPGFFIIKSVHIDPEFGKKTRELKA